MKIAIIAAEISPWAKVGGLADVISALPAALKSIGADPVVIVPGYKAILDRVGTKTVARGQSVKLDGEREEFAILETTDARGVTIRLIDHAGFFGRSEIYGAEGRDYPDNLRRFIFFSRAALVAAAMLAPDVIHAHDWHAAAAPIIMRADPEMRSRFARTLSVFTIHNLAFQGLGTRADFALLDVAPEYYTKDLEFYDRLNLMKGAIRLADAVSTVSPTYAREVTSGPELGFGLEGVLREKEDRFHGILNGADYEEWNPAADPDLAAPYSAADPSGKAACKRHLRERAGLPHKETTPLIGMVSRMTTQKGFDLLRDAIDDLMWLDLQLVMLAAGEPGMEAFFRAAERRYRDRLRVMVEFNSASAHRVQAGSDAFLMPSRFEPCGLTQMYALRYGTAPIVRATGGLCDTVSEFDPASGTGNGFVFKDYVAADLIAAVIRTLNVYRDQPKWRRLMANAFAADFSWEHAAHVYLDWFEKLRRELNFS
ncbi:MAG TPA: glycogen synthase GlgA [Candidatus Binataceae bacterium]|nr:glycogen synthase GlgA [Candidatus Binataceae bacterium]